jgi:hypothetical protein
MRYLTQTEFATECDCSQQAISKGIQEGRVIRAEKGIDPSHPTNIHFKENAARNSAKVKRGFPDKKKASKKAGRKKKRKAAKATSRSKAGKKKKTEHQLELDIDWEGGELPANVGALSRATTDKLKTIEQIHALRIKTDRERQELVERELVRRLFAKMYLIDTNELKTLADKLPADIAGLAGIDDRAVVMAIGERIEREVYRSLAHIKRLINDFFTEIGADLIQSKKEAPQE